MSIKLTESQKAKLKILAEMMQQEFTDDIDTLFRNMDELNEECVDIPAALLEVYGIDVNSEDD